MKNVKNKKRALTLKSIKNSPPPQKKNLFREKLSLTHVSKFQLSMSNGVGCSEGTYKHRHKYSHRAITGEYFSVSTDIHVEYPSTYVKVAVSN